MKFAIRVNTLKTTREEFLGLLDKEGVGYEEFLPYDLAFIIPDLPKEQFTALPLYTEGLCYIQSLSSQLPVIVLDPQPQERVLDLCAAPGGKTLQIADHMENTGEVVANDVSRNRLFKVRAMLERYGVENVTVRNSRGEQMWRREEGAFDRVLIDAPCSMCQVLPAKKIRSLAKRQRALLHSAYTMTKPGGVLVYSTCTLTQEENEDTVSWLLDREEGATLEGFEFKDSWESDQTKTGTLRIESSENGFEPFFLAKFRKSF